MSKFELGKTLAEVLGGAADAADEQIVLLPLDALEADGRNFYSTDGVEALAANIETVGLLDALRVRPDPEAPGRYRIVSGHRRRLALQTLAEADPKRWERVPCIVETAEASPEMQELRLIYANADTRRMTSFDQAKQAERVTELLYALKAQGVDFPGRMRDHVAEACKIGESKLGELKVIREKLTNEQIRPLWEAGKLNHAQAYAIAKAKPYTQAALVTYLCINELPGTSSWALESRIRKIETIAERKCKHTGGYCENCEAMLDRVLRQPGAYAACEYHCCRECPEITKCKSVCKWHQADAERKKAEEKERKAAERAKEKTKEDAAIGVTREIWRRFGELRKANGLSAEDLCKARGESYYGAFHGQDWLETMEAPGAKIGEHTSVPWGTLQADDVMQLRKTAEALGCSCDYLLGASDEPRPFRSEWISVDERYPDEGTYCMAMTRAGTVQPSVYFRAAFMDFTEKSVANRRIERVEWWSPLPAPPEGVRWMGSETLKQLIGGGK